MKKTDTPDPQLRQQLDALLKKFDEAFNNNDPCNCADLLAAFGYFLEDGWGLRLWCTSDRHFEAITDRNHKITSDIFSGARAQSK